MKLLQNTQYFSRVAINNESRYPAQPAEWPAGGHKLQDADPFQVEYFGPGTVQILTGHEVIPTLAIKIYITGHTEIPTSTPGITTIKARFEFLRDGEPSEFTGGFLYLHK